MTISIQGISPEIAVIIQDNTLERVFHDALFPQQLYRADATPERWAANLGEEMSFTRTGILPSVTTPLAAGTDPTPQTYSVEQWVAIASQYGGAIDTHMPTSRTALAPKVLRDAQTLGMQAGQSVNRLVRNRLFRAYLAGNTCANGAVGSGTASVPVASLNGFTEVLVNGRPTPVSAAAPLAVTFGGTEPTRNVIAATPDDPANPLGPGTLTLSANLTIGLADREAVLAANRSVIQRVGGGDSVEAIGGADIITLNDIIAAVATLRANNVPTHPDGRYHCHLSPEAVAQIFQDNHWQRLHDSLPQNADYQSLMIGDKARCYHYENSESPNDLNSGTLVSSGTASAQCSGDIGGEVTTNAGQRVLRAIVTGRAACYEKYVDESEYLSEAGAQGRIGNFNVINGGVMVMTDRIRYILRSPQDRLQQIVSHAWSWSGDFPVPSDGLSGGAARYKRAVVIEHAG